MTSQFPSDEGAPPSDPPSTSTPYVFPPGVDKLDEEALMAVSPKDLVWTHRSAAGLADSLIMMVDDEELNVEMTQAFLQEAGYTNFTHTSDSRQALDRMRANPPAVLLLDLSMPHVSGMDILHAMRQDKELRHIPVIVLTSTIEPHVKLQALAAGAMDFLSKPVDPSELALRLRNTLAASAYRDFLAEHDPLTGLPNKLRYRKFATEVLHASITSGRSGALVHVGMDKLGPINDGLGRAVGDQMLQRLAKRLASSVETEVGGELSSGLHEPALFRFDGDEFAIVLPHVESKDSAAAFISKLLDDSAVALVRGGQDVFATCSIGIVAFPQDGREATELMNKASLTMRKAKEAGQNRFEFFSPKFNEAAVSRLNIAAELRRAVSRGHIEMRYEPRLEAETSRLVAAEAVVYWRHASGRTVYGDELLELAAATDVGGMLAEWSLEQVMNQVASWRKAKIDCVPVRLAVSLSQISAADLLALANKGVRAGDDPRMFIIEWQQIPALDALLTREAAAIAELSRLGFTVSLGRFGSGQSTLALLGKLPISQVRLDASMARDYDRNPRMTALFEGTIRLVRDMGLTCIVSGVTNLQQLMVLRKAGAQQYQGPLVDEPLGALEFAAKRLAPRGKAAR